MIHFLAALIMPLAVLMLFVVLMAIDHFRTSPLWLAILWALLGVMALLAWIFLVFT